VCVAFFLRVEWVSLFFRLSLLLVLHGVRVKQVVIYINYIYSKVYADIHFETSAITTTESSTKSPVAIADTFKPWSIIS
jgi:hypothetical protein